jgi:hypothetical protein
MRLPDILAGEIFSLNFITNKNVEIPVKGCGCP